MTIKLQDLVSELKLEDKLTPASKTALSSLKGLSIGVGLVTAAAGTAALGFKKMIDLTFDWATQLDSIQDVMGGTTKQAAALNFVVQKSGTDLETFTNGMTILEKGLVKADGSLDVTGKKLAQFGINVLDANGQVKNQSDLVGDISNRYNQFSTQQERVNFLTEIFGKSGAKLVDVFDTLANDGGLDATANKVEKLGLVIDPAKYEQFTRTLNEIKLSGQGLAITVVDKLMPALTDFSKWWLNQGLPFTMQMVDWVDKNTIKWESLKSTWQDHVAPVLTQLGSLFNNINGILERLSPSTDAVAGKFTLLGIVQREAVAVATVVNGTLKYIENGLKLINAELELAINLWDAFKRGLSVIKNVVIPKPSSTFNTGRATGGAVLEGVGYNTVELNRPEVFTPFTAGRIDPMKSQSVTARIDENLLARVIAGELAKVMG